MLELIEQGELQSTAQQQMNVSLEMLEAVANDPEFGSQVRVYTPEPSLAFSRRETLLPGFGQAKSKALEMGYEPIIRTSGGRAVAYDQDSLVFDLVVPEVQRKLPNDFVFYEFSVALVGLFRSIGLATQIGEIPGEYCPGKYSIHFAKVQKLVGTAQRNIRGARLISGFIHLGEIHRIQEVLTKVYAATDFDWNPATVGSTRTAGIDISASELSGLLTHELTDFGQHLFRKNYH